MIYLLTAIGLKPGGSSTVHIYTQTVHRTTQNKQYIEQHKNIRSVRAVPHLCGFYPGICLTTEGEARKNLSQVNRYSSSSIWYYCLYESKFCLLRFSHNYFHFAAHSQDQLPIFKLWISPATSQQTSTYTLFSHNLQLHQPHHLQLINQMCYCLWYMCFRPIN
jgi:hypothetical protein